MKTPWLGGNQTGVCSLCNKMQSMTISRSIGLYQATARVSATSFLRYIRETDLESSA